MIGYWIGPVFTITCVGLYTAYWVRRLEREHRTRLAQIDAESAADAERFEALKRELAESRARSDAADEEHYASMYRDFVTPPGAGSELTITMTLRSTLTAAAPVEISRIRIPIEATQLDRAIAELDEVGRRLAVGG